MECRAILEYRVPEEVKEILVSKASVAQMEPMALMVYREQMAHKELKDFKA
jgi:hypothetical protein